MIDFRLGSCDWCAERPIVSCAASRGFEIMSYLWLNSKSTWYYHPVDTANLWLHVVYKCFWYIDDTIAAECKHVCLPPRGLEAERKLREFCHHTWYHKTLARIGCSVTQPGVTHLTLNLYGGLTPLRFHWIVCPCSQKTDSAAVYHTSLVYVAPQWLHACPQPMYNNYKRSVVLLPQPPTSLAGSLSVPAAVQTPPEEKAKEKEEPPAEAKVGDLVETFMGRGQVRGIREEDGMLEVWAMGWEMAGEQRPRFFVTRDTVKVVPTVYYKMPGTWWLCWPVWGFQVS